MNKELPGINTRDYDQLWLLGCLAKGAEVVETFPEQEIAGTLYYFDNPFFSYGDASVLTGMLKMYQPRSIVEVGAGLSTCLMVELMQAELFDNCQLRTIDVDAGRFLSRMPAHTQKAALITVQESKVQDVPLSVFTDLGNTDVLFIDSSHVVAPGSDTEFLLFEVIPRLRHGVIIHLHDIFWPFQYPTDWLTRGWNECSHVRALLQNNNRLNVLLFNDYLAKVRPSDYFKALPLAAKNPGGSLWLQVNDHQHV